MKQRLLVANWKMNPNSLDEARKLFSNVKKYIINSRKTEVVICPPFVYLENLIKLGSSKKHIKFGAQNIFWERKGPFTGEISANSISDLGASYVIIGHSERRAMGETDEIVNKKINAALKAGLNPILCIGESVRDSEGKYLSFLASQIEKDLKNVGLKNLQKVVIAYEPIWAIGKAETAAVTPVTLHQMVIFIRKTLKEIYKHKSSLQTKVIYGGSVGPGNVEELLKEGKADGFLVGHESLEAKDFIEIFKTF